MDIATISKLIDAGFTAQEIRTFAGAGTGANANSGATTPAGAAPNPGNAGTVTGTSVSTGTSAGTGATAGAGTATNDAAELAKMLRQMQENLQKQPEPNQAQNPDGQTMRDLLGAIRNLNTTIQAGAILNSNMPPLKSDADIAAGGLANILNPFAEKTEWREITDG